MKDHRDLRINPNKLEEVGYAFYCFYEVNREKLIANFDNHVSDEEEPWNFPAFCFGAFMTSYREYQVKLN